MQEWVRPDMLMAAAGGVGAVARHVLSLLARDRAVAAILLINIAGSLLLGLSLGLINEHGSGFLLLALASFCSGFTTFSSFAVQVRDTHHRRTVLHAAALVTAHVVLCVAAAAAGWRLVVGVGTT